MNNSSIPISAMLCTPEGANRQNVERYMRQHNIKEVMESMLADVIYSCPEEPFKRMANFLERVQSGELLIESDETSRSHQSGAAQHASQVSTTKEELQRVHVDANQLLSGGVHEMEDEEREGPQRESAFAALFRRLDTDSDGFIEMADFSAAIEHENVEGAFLSGSHKVRSMLEEWDQGSGERQTLSMEEFTTAMKQLFFYQYRHLVSSCSFDQLFAQTMVDNLEHPLLREEAKELQPLRSLREAPQSQAERLVEFVMEKLRARIRADVSTLFRAAAKYEMQEEQKTGGKFHEMVLGASETFDLGPEGLFGLPGSDVEGSIEREHSSTEEFTAWNNDVERTTSPAEQFQKALPQGWAGKVNPFDYRGQVDLCGDCHQDFMQHPVVKKAGLSKAEVVALRMYTGPMYKQYNGALRCFLPKMEEYLEREQLDTSTASLLAASKFARAELGTSFATTIHALASAIQKLRRENPLPERLRVYRGFAGLALPPRFVFRDRKGNRGGVEFAFMSTSADKAQALGYIRFDKGMPRLFEMEVGHIDRGADLSWISYFPAEAEVLMPPLSGVEVKGEPHYETMAVEVPDEGGRAVTRTEQRMVQVWQIGLNVNVKAKTMEEHQSTRKQLFLKAAEEGRDEVNTDVRGFRLTAAFEAGAGRDVFLMREGEEKESAIAGFEDSVLAEWQAALAEWDATEAAAFNRPAAFQRAYSRLLEMLRLVQLKKRLWLRAPEQGLPNIALLSLREAKRAGLARNRARLAASPPCSEAEQAAAALELLQFRGVVAGDLEELVDGETALHRACAEGSREVTCLLLMAKADANRPAAGGQETPLILAARAGSAEICGLLLDARASVDAVETRVGGSAVYWAAVEGYANAVELLISRSADVNLLTAGQGSPLGIAAYYGHLACVRLLLAANAEVDAQKNTGSSPLYLSSQNGHSHVVQALVEAKCAVDLANESGATPLFAAASDNHVQTVEKLIAAKCDVGRATNDGSTPLSIATIRNHFAVVDLLIAAKCNVDEVTSDGCTLVYLASRKGNLETIDRLIAAQCDVNKAEQGGFTPLHVAAECNCVEAMDRLITAKCDVHVATDEGSTALWIASSFNHAHAVDRLIVAKCAVDKASNDGCSPLFIASQENSLGAMDRLIAAKCDVDLAKNEGLTPLYIAASRDHIHAVDRLIAAKCAVDKASNDGCSPLFIASQENSLGAMDRLIAAKCDVDEARSDGCTPLYAASMRNNAEAVDRLIAAKCDTNKAATDGATPLFRASQESHLDAMGRLIAANCDVDKATNAGMTPLYIAAQFNHVEAMDHLIAAKCSVDTATHAGATPLFVAAQGNSVEAVDRLIAASCDVDKAERQGATPLFIASQKNCARAIASLLAAKCDPEKAVEGTNTFPLFVACANNNVEAIDLLIAANCDVDRTQRQGATALFVAAQQNFVKAIGSLIAAKCSVDKAKDDNVSPLFVAAANNNVEAMHLLITAECDVSKARSDGWTPLIVSIQENSLDATDLLIAAKCNVDQPTNNGVTPLLVAAFKGSVEAVKRLLRAGADRTVQVGADGTTAVHYARKVEDGERRKELEALLRFEAWEVGGSTALHRAAGENRAEAVAGIVAEGCDAAALNALGLSALHLAATSNSPEAAAALAAAGAPLEARDPQGRTPLARAAAEGQEEAAAALVAARADPAASDSAGRSAAVLAALGGHRALLRRLAPSDLPPALSPHWHAAWAVGAAPLLLVRGPPDGVHIDPAARTVAFSSFCTLAFQHRCPAGGRAYYELRILEALETPQVGFAAEGFAACAGASSDGVGDDRESWGVDGVRSRRWAADAPDGESDYGVSWKEGDVVGLACDLQAQQIAVSVNGDFAPPNGAILDLSAAPPAELWAVFSAGGGKVECNFGEEGRALAFAGPSEEAVPMARAHLGLQ